MECLTKLKVSATGEFDDDSVKAQIGKGIQVYEQRPTSSTRRRSFRKAGLEYYVTDRPVKLQVVEESLRENPGFREIRARDVSIEALSARRWAQRFGIINSEFLTE
jgi:hypothetical protein